MNRCVPKARNLVFLNSFWERQKLPIFQREQIMDGWRLKFKPSTDMTKATTFEMNEAMDLAKNGKLLPTFLDGNSDPRTLFQGSYVNINHQGTFYKDLNRHTPYAHVLLQVHETHRTGMDTLLAIVLMPLGHPLPVSVVREAFLGSLLNEAEAWIVK
jgi:hypothetical protein